MVDNPFQKIDISVPKSFHEEFTRYCKHNEGIDQSPFPRMVDLWFLSVCIAVRLGLEPLEKYNTTKIINGSIFSDEPWRIHVLMLIAIERSGDEQIVLEPNKMLTLVNNLATAGLPKVIEMIKKNGNVEPIWNLSDSVAELLRKENN